MLPSRREERRCEGGRVREIRHASIRADWFVPSPSLLSFFLTRFETDFAPSSLPPSNSHPPLLSTFSFLASLLYLKPSHSLRRLAPPPLSSPSDGRPALFLLLGCFRGPPRSSRICLPRWFSHCWARWCISPLGSQVCSEGFRERENDQVSLTSPSLVDGRNEGRMSFPRSRLSREEATIEDLLGQ